MGWPRLWSTLEGSPDLKCTFTVGERMSDGLPLIQSSTLPLNLLNVTNLIHIVMTDAIKFFYRFLQTLEVSIVHFVIVSLHI